VTGHHEPQTPVSAEKKLEDLDAEIAEASQLLIHARDVEAQAQEIRDEAWRNAMLDKRCPPVGVFGGVRTTVAMQEAWVAREIAGPEGILRRATLARKQAADRLNQLNSSASHQQTLAKSVGGAYGRTTGRGGW
jgi:hypothetical protein